MVLVEQERHPHTALSFFPRVVEGNGAFPLTVLTPVLKLESSELCHIRFESTADRVTILACELESDLFEDVHAQVGGKVRDCLATEVGQRNLCKRLYAERFSLLIAL